MNEATKLRISKSVLEFYKNNPNKIGFKSGDENVAKREDVRKKLSLKSREYILKNGNPALKPGVGEKISESLKGRVITDDWKEKIRQSNLIVRIPGQPYTRSLVIRERIAGRKKPEHCEICGSKKMICFDHDHKTGKFRGWICNNCNVVLGFINDDPKILVMMLKYLRSYKHRSRH